MPRFSTLPLSVALLLASLPALGRADDSVQYNRDIRSILADKCFACHGSDDKNVKANLRLDVADAATKPAESGAVAIVPGKPDESELVRRIFAEDDERMPPEDSNKELTSRERELLKLWVRSGAEYQDHWSFLPPRRPGPPNAGEGLAAIAKRPGVGDWSRSAIDRFVLDRLISKKLLPSLEASRPTLIRRVSQDLRGFPPTLAEIEEFLADSQDGAYERMVDRMISSPHFGEKMARIWMDLARYGDTNGYHYDSTRQVWMWRDWVIRAYNDNMPFDQFTIEQLAGDLMPSATVQQKIASGFNRNTRYNEEGGADPEEWRIEYAKDRTRTLGQVWLGMTMGCAECHSHKYDPITQREFYQLYAFFNSLDEPGAQGHNQKYPPLLEVPTADQQQRIDDLEDQISRTRQEILDKVAAVDYREPTDLPTEPQAEPVDVVWIDDDTPTGANLQGQGNPPWQWITKDQGPVHHGERATKRTGKGLIQHYFTEAKEPLKIEAGDVLFAWVWLDPKDPPKTVQLQFNDGSWEHRGYWGAPRAFGGGKQSPASFKVDALPKTGEWVRLEVPASSVGLKPGAMLNGWAFTQFDGTVYYDHAGVTRTTTDVRHLRSLAIWQDKAGKDKSVPAPIRKAIGEARRLAKKAAQAEKKAAAEKTGQQVGLDEAERNQLATAEKTVRDYYIENVFGETREQFAALRERMKSAEQTIGKTKSAVPFQLVSVELPKPRPAFMLIRGQFDKPGEPVERGVPEFLPPLPESAPLNRLGLAQWVVSGDHPLTARVSVNRYWAQLFGRGIVETIGDFGTLGRYPTHPALLDWLAVEFVESGWNTKHMIKLMVMSATYRQSSVNDRRHDDVDGENNFLWRAPRFRLPAEEIRDSALKISGLLSPKVGGPPVFPYQPAKYYDGKKGGWGWNVSQADDRYRRGLYTFWRRTTPYPTFIIFDAPDRSQCIVARARTNTPLQALATMNDPQFVEAAREFARRILQSEASDDVARLRAAFRTAVAREPSAAEQKVLSRLLAVQREHYSAEQEAANGLAQSANGETPEQIVERAVWTTLCNVILNLDETITRE
ncbi:MAG: PSD1 and planctomycete cytochrome C domain-containing protein [Pirellulaceae bacterium]|jgi:hypothetical protein|nr:PSD1 and planctomycete cytochrome C domain-containing protein [Pirellulaceae bacterium]